MDNIDGLLTRGAYQARPEHGVRGLELSVLKFAGMKPVRQTLLGTVDAKSIDQIFRSRHCQTLSFLESTMTEPARNIGGPSNREGHMSVEARGLLLAGLLAALAGMVDVIGYLHLNGPSLSLT